MVSAQRSFRQREGSVYSKLLFILGIALQVSLIRSEEIIINVEDAIRLKDPAYLPDKLFLFFIRDYAGEHRKQYNCICAFIILRDLPLFHGLKADLRAFPSAALYHHRRKVISGKVSIPFSAQDPQHPAVSTSHIHDSRIFVRIFGEALPVKRKRKGLRFRHAVPVLFLFHQVTSLYLF